MSNIWPFASRLFGVLAIIEFAWSAVVLSLEKNELQSWTSALIRKIMTLGAFYTLLIFGPNWIPLIIDSFSQMGASAAGISANRGLEPSTIFAWGLAIAGSLLKGAAGSALMTNFGTAAALVFAATLVVLSYAVVMIQYVVTVVESYIVVGAGLIFLGFGGSRWTAPYVERYIALGVSIGVKIMLLYMLIAGGMGLSNTWLNEANGVASSVTPAIDAFDVMGAALLFTMLCWQIPKLCAAVLGGGPALTGGDLVGTGLLLGEAAIAGATLAGGGFALVAGGPAAAAGVGAAGMAVGSGASSAAGLLGGGGGSGGSVPPPPFPSGGGDSGGSSPQPQPPGGGGSGGSGSRDSALVGTARDVSPPSSSSSTAATRASGMARSSVGGASDTVAAAAAAIGGQSVTGSGFETERPAGRFRASMALPPRIAEAPAATPEMTPAGVGSSVFAATPSGPASTGQFVMWGSGGAAASPVPGALMPRREAAPGIIAGAAPNGQVLVRSAGGQPLPPTGGTSGATAPQPAAWVRPPTANELAAYQAEFAALAAEQDPPDAPDGKPTRPVRAAPRRVSRGTGARLGWVAYRVGTRLASDAAPHAAPPRLNIEHHD